MITLSIDITKIDKSRFFQGKKGKYLDLIMIESPNSKFGDYIVKQSLSREERAQGLKPDLPILGNGKIMVKGNKGQPQPPKDEWD